MNCIASCPAEATEVAELDNETLSMKHSFRFYFHSHIYINTNKGNIKSREEKANGTKKIAQIDH